MAKAKYQNLISEANKLVCACKYKEKSKGRGKKKKIKTKTCRRCEYVNEANSISVEVYEWPLPNEEHLQDAVVFELRIPEIISNLRDSVYILNTKILKIKKLYKISNNCLWRNRADLIEFKLHSKSETAYITLGSSEKRVLNTHYASKNINDAPISSFIVLNASNVCLIDVVSNTLIDFNIPKNQIYKSMCTFNIESEGKNVWI